MLSEIRSRCRDSDAANTYNSLSYGRASKFGNAHWKIATFLPKARFPFPPMKHWATVRDEWQVAVTGPGYDPVDRDTFYITRAHLDDKFHTYGSVVCDFCNGA
jgi:hypothetical protein